MQNSGGKLILEHSTITGSVKLNLPEFGMYLEGSSQTSVVASEINNTRSHGIYCAGDAVCFLESSVVSDCQGDGIKVVSGQAADGNRALLLRCDLQLRNSHVRNNDCNGVLLRGEGVTAHVGNRSVIRNNGECGVLAVAGSAVDVNSSRMTGNKRAAIAAKQSKIGVTDCVLEQDNQEDGSGRSTIVASRWGSLLCTVVFVLVAHAYTFFVFWAVFKSLLLLIMMLQYRTHSAIFLCILSDMLHACWKRASRPLLWLTASCASQAAWKEQRD